MERLLEGDEQLDRELAPERAFAPAMGSLLLHGGLIALMALYILIAGLFRPTMWGSPGKGGVMNAVLVTSPVPLPTHQPTNDNVLATETPSQAPALPNQKTQQLQDLNAIPIPGKKVKPKKESVHKTPQHQPAQQRQNVVPYGEQSGSNIQRSMQQQGFNGQTAIQNGNFGTQFPWYATMVNNKVDQNWYKTEVNPATPKGSRVYIAFTIQSDGSATNVQISQPSGSSTLDYSCLHAVQRVQAFPPLPGGYREINVNFWCDY
ncbi:MAG TPA: energy transducer TonB [Terracidiphilus sp.]|nr:energy transducer TonB [Terracidiphilus sp.]